MPSAVRRSEELQKKLQRRNNSLKPADFTKEQALASHVEVKPDPVEKSKAALSDIRKRIDERKRQSKLVNVQQYQEKREETAPEMARATFSNSPVPQRQEPQGLKSYYKDRKSVSAEKVEISDEKAPPAHIEVRSSIDGPETKNDDDTEVSEITTDVRLMTTKGASYAGNVQKKIPKSSLSTPTGGRPLERDVNINVSNLRHLGKAVEQAKMDLQRQMAPANDTTRHGLPYESTDYQPSEDEADSWGDAIRSSSQKKQEKSLFIAGKKAAKKLQTLVKEAYSHEGDVFIDATEIREEDLDGDENASEVGDEQEPQTELDENTVNSAELRDLEKKVNDKLAVNGHDVETNELPEQAEEEKKESDVASIAKEDDFPDDTQVDHENTEDNEEPPTGDSGEQPSNFGNNPAAMASEFYNNSLSFFKTFSSQVDSQLKTFQERGLISKADFEGMLGIMKRDVKETESSLPKDTDNAAINLGDDFDSSECGSHVETVEEEMKSNTGSNFDSVEKMLESMKNSYNIGIAKCGINSDLIKENTKAIEQMVANLKNSNGSSPTDDDQNNDSYTPEDDIDGDIDGDVLKELSEEDSPDKPVPLAGAKGGNKTFMLSFSMPGSQ